MTELQKNHSNGLASHRTIVHSLLKQEMPVTFRAAGPSMNPTIRSGDLVHVAPAANERLPLGSILLFQQHTDRLTLHRYVNSFENSGRIGTTGDAAVAGMEMIDRTDVCGVALWLERGQKRVQLNSWGRRWTGMLRFYTRPIRRFAIAFYRARRARPSRTEPSRE